MKHIVRNQNDYYDDLNFEYNKYNQIEDLGDGSSNRTDRTSGDETAFLNHPSLPYINQP